MAVQTLRGSSTAILSDGGRLYVKFDHTLFDSDNNATSTSTLTAPTDGSRWVLGGWITSYSDDPAAAAAVTITNQGNSISFDATKGGLAPIQLPYPIYFDPDTAVTLTLAASGTVGVVGKIYPIAWKERPPGSP